MPVKRFRTFEEAEQALWCMQPDAAYFRQVRQLFDLAGKLSRVPAVKPGIYKYRAIDDRDREQGQNLLKR